MIYNMILLIFFAFLHAATRAEVATGACHCAVFKESVKEPLIEHALPFDVTCDDDGAEKCSQLCYALAQSAKDKAPAMLCEKLNRHIENLKVAVHTKSCGLDEWKFTGLESSHAICCHEGKETACNVTVVAI